MSKKVVIITVILSVIALILGIVSVSIFNNNFMVKENPIQELPKVPQYVDNEEEDDIFTTPVVDTNILIVGTDKSEKLADVIIVCRYNPYTNKISLLSIPRDTRVTHKKQNLKINSVYQYGVGTLIEKVETITNLSIDNNVVFSTDSFKEVIDILGGVDFDVPQNMKYNDPVQDLHINLKKGFQHLDGEQAEQLIRYRQYAAGDLKRIEVQQKFIKALIEQKFTPSLIPKAPALAKELLATLKTDLHLSDISPYISNLSNIENISIETYTLPGIADYIDDVSYYIQDKDETREVVNNFLNGITETTEFSSAEKNISEN
jgi:LCP family protein required for cell wall assembly